MLQHGGGTHGKLGDCGPHPAAAAKRTTRLATSSRIPKPAIINAFNLMMLSADGLDVSLEDEDEQSDEVLVIV